MGIHIRTVSFDDLALFIDDELGEVPFYEVTQQATLFFLQIRPKRMRVVSVHVDFLEQIEFYLENTTNCRLQIYSRKIGVFYRLHICSIVT